MGFTDAVYETAAEGTEPEQAYAEVRASMGDEEFADGLVERWVWLQGTEEMGEVLREMVRRVPEQMFRVEYEFERIVQERISAQAKNGEGR